MGLRTHIFSLRLSEGNGPKSSGGVWSPPMPVHHLIPPLCWQDQLPTLRSALSPSLTIGVGRSLLALHPCLCRAERPALELLLQLRKPVLTDLMSTSKRDSERGVTAGVASSAQSNCPSCAAHVQVEELAIAMFFLCVCETLLINLAKTCVSGLAVAPRAAPCGGQSIAYVFLKTDTLTERARRAAHEDRRSNRGRHA